MSHDHDLDPGHAARTADFRALLRRREALLAMGTGVAGVYGMRELAWSPDEADAACVLQRQVTEGPYYLDLDGGQADTSNAGDMIYADAGSRALLSMRRKGSAVSSGYTGSLVIGVDPS